MQARGFRQKASVFWRDEGEVIDVVLAQAEIRRWVSTLGYVLHLKTEEPKELHCPKLDAALSSLIADLDGRGLLDETLVVAIGEFGRSPRMGVSTSGNNAPDGRDRWPYCYTAVMAGAGIKRGGVYGKSDEHASSPIETPVHPTEVLATIYHALGINPATMVMNHLNQPRELVKAEPVYGLYG
jgi:uncharacterized protein (DUF1501 family)